MNIKPAMQFRAFATGIGLASGGALGLSLKAAGAENAPVSIAGVGAGTGAVLLSSTLAATRGAAAMTGATGVAVRASRHAGLFGAALAAGVAAGGLGAAAIATD